MDDDHADDALLIVQTLGGAPDATEALAVDVDGAGMRFRVDGARDVVVPFATPVTERAQVRLAVVELHQRASAAVGR